MVYLAIDTCSLLQLVDKNGYNTYISELQNHINNDKVRLITHKIVIDEWDKHKVKLQRAKERSLLHVESQQKIGEYYDAVPNTINNIEHLELQTKQIDEILSKSYQLDSVPETLKHEVADRILNKLAPFGKKIDSINDWFVIGSVCTYCHNNQIKEIHFISKNFNDFADESKKDIHPSIQERFAEVSIKYYHNYSDFFNELSNNIELIYSNRLFTIPINEKYSYNSTIKKSVLESIYYIYNQLYAEVQFIPLHILTKYYPFRGEERKFRYESFVLHNTTKETVKFFENISVDESDFSFKNEDLLHGIVDYKSKTEYILIKLTNNLIYSVKGSDPENNISTYYRIKGECECCRCSYNKFNFYDTFDKLNLNIDTVEDKLKSAYINYKLGNIKSAYILYVEICIKSYRERKFIIYFIAKYNLSHLSKFLNNFFFNKDIDNVLIEDLRKIDPIEEALKLKPFTDYNLLLFIAQEDFFTEAFQNIKLSLSSIIDHYDSQLDGGWSSENSFLKLSEEFAKLEYFLNKNFIIYDRYLNFENMFQMVIEGLLCAHATQEKSGGHLEKLDIYWIHKIMIYGNRKHIIKYYKKYNLKCLKVDLECQKYFIDVSENFFKNQSYKDDIEIYLNNSGNGYYDQMYNSMLETIITVASVISTNRYNTNLFAENLLSFMREKGVRLVDIKLVVDFIKSKRANIDSRVILEYFDYYFNELERDCFSFIKAIVDSLKKEDFLAIDERRIMEILDKVFSAVKETKNDSYEIIVNIYKKVNGNIKKYMRDKIKEILIDNFSFDLFYLSTIFNIIPFDKEKVFDIIDKLELKATESWRTIFSGVEEFRIYQLDELLNILFKFNIHLDELRMRRIKEFHPYYRWVIDIDNFNYKDFDLSWIIVYPTVYYFKRMAKSRKLVQILLKREKSQNNIRISKAVVRILSLG